jgi:UDP-2-acetamido-3-amino-2,3-dideoxy-glucuronate N-acetyltransferase
MTNGISVAVLGCGYWGQNLVRNFQALNVLKAICDPSAKGREKGRELAPEARLSSDYTGILGDPEIHAVVVATPAETHFAVVAQALAAGKDVFVEKPLAINYREGLSLQRQAEQAGRILMVGHLLEYHPAVVKLKELLEAGELGRINYVYSNRLNFGKIRVEENALWSFAPHDIAVILRLVGEEPLEVTCTGGSYITPNLADVTVSCLHFRTGLRAHIFVSWLNPFKEQKLVVMGDRKMAVFNDTSQHEKLSLYDQHVDVNMRQPVLQKGAMDVIPISTEEPLRRECEEFLCSIATRRRPLTDGRSGVRVLRVLQACQISLQLNGRPIPLSDIIEETE